MNWIHIRLAEHLGLIAWVMTASGLYVDRWWRCRREHCRPGECPAGQFTAWDEAPPATEATPAEDGRDAVREAS